MYFLRSPIFKQAFRSRYGLGPEELAHPTFLFVTIAFWTRFSHMGQGAATWEITFVLIIFSSVCKEVVYRLVDDTLRGLPHPPTSILFDTGKQAHRERG